MNNNNPIKKFKCIFLGQSSVGKSSIIYTFIENKFNKNISNTIGTAFYKKEYKNDNIQLNIWDTCGEEKFFSIANLYYKDANVIIFVIDITDLDKSLKTLDYYLNDVNNKSEVDNIKYLFINKIDLINKNEKNEFNSKIDDVKNKYSMIFKKIFESSALLNIGIKEGFKEIVEDLKLYDFSVEKSVDLLKNTDKENNKRCCFN